MSLLPMKEGMPTGHLSRAESSTLQHALRTPFEGMIGEWRERVAQETERVTTNLLKAGELAAELAAGSVRNDTCTVADLEMLSGNGARFGATLAEYPDLGSDPGGG
jgi:hypothetical protein